MSKMPDDMIDLVVTSPPYDHVRIYDGYADTFDFEKTADALFRVLKPGGVIVWVVSDQVKDGDESGTSFKQALYFKGLGLKLYDTMIYTKQTRSGIGNNKTYYQNFEYMFVISKGLPKTVNLIKDRKNRHCNFETRSSRRPDGTKEAKRRKFKQDEFGRRNNVWRYETGIYHSTKEKVAFQHPAIFPDKLAADHIISWSNKGDVVYDPFAGSGTTLKQAMILHRNYIGSEISSKYCDIIRARLHTMEQFT